MIKFNPFNSNHEKTLARKTAGYVYFYIAFLYATIIHTRWRPNIDLFSVVVKYLRLKDEDKDEYPRGQGLRVF